MAAPLGFSLLPLAKDRGVWCALLIRLIFGGLGAGLLAVTGAAQSGNGGEAPGFEGFDGTIEVLTVESAVRQDSNLRRTDEVSEERPIALPIARIRALDKVTARLTAFDIRVGEAKRFGTLSILVEACLTNPPSQTPEDRAFIRIVDNPLKSAEAEVFGGWMFSSSPALHALEHAIFDVWLVSCLSDAEVNLAGQQGGGAEESESSAAAYSTAALPVTRPAEQPERQGPSDI